VECAFDSVRSCTLTVHVCATEIVNEKNATVRFDCSSLFPPRSYRLNAGANQLFRQSCEHAIDISRLSNTQLAANPSIHYYPLIVSLQCDDEPSSVALSASLSPSAAAVASSSSSSAPPLHVQYQATYCSFIPVNARTVDCRVLKQKIQVDGYSYELQEIYGLEPKQASSTTSVVPAATADTLPPNAQKDASGRIASPVVDTASASPVPPQTQECVVCLNNPRDTTILPCRHMCLCHECADILRTQTNRCPVCRSPVESLLHLHINR